MSDLSQKTSEQLHVSEARYKDMIINAPDAILVIDPHKGDILEVNIKAEGMTNYPSAELLNMAIWDLHPAEEKEILLGYLKDVGKAAVLPHRDLHLKKKDGEVIEIGLNASHFEDGKEDRVQCVYREKNSTEGPGADLRKYFEDILNMMPVGLGLKKDVDSKPTIEFENSKLKEMFHGAPDDSEHLAWHTNSMGKRIDVIASISEDRVYLEERAFPDGRFFLFSSSFFKNHENSWCELQIVQDITERKLAEQALKKANEDLELTVEERTSELKLKQAQLLQSEKMASLGSLVAGVAHEINTPLGALNSNNDIFIRTIEKLKTLLLDPALAKEISQNADVTRIFENLEKLNAVNREAADRILTIVRSLRRFARLDKAELEQMDIHQGIDSTLTLVHHQIKNRIEVIKDYGQVPLVKCYPDRLNQVFMNILVNASQAIPDRGEIIIRTAARDEFVVIEFIDTGTGMTEENLRRIFEPGFTTKGTGVGTGLGLSIVQEIIKDHKGRIEAESSPGKGTTMRIILPIDTE